MSIPLRRRARARDHSPTGAGNCGSAIICGGHLSQAHDRPCDTAIHVAAGGFEGTGRGSSEGQCFKCPSYEGVGQSARDTDCPGAGRSEAWQSVQPGAAGKWIALNRVCAR
jgi:hypothetical protein